MTEDIIKLLIHAELARHHIKVNEIIENDDYDIDLLIEDYYDHLENIKIIVNLKPSRRWMKINMKMDENKLANKMLNDLVENK